MKMKKKNWQVALIAVVVIGALYALNKLNERKPARESINQLIARHQGALVLVKSNTGRDQEFLQALEGVRHQLAGKAGVVIAGPDSDVLEPGQSATLPVLLVMDSHGNQLHRFEGSLDPALFQELVQQLATHHH